MGTRIGRSRLTRSYCRDRSRSSRTPCRTRSGLRVYDVGRIVADAVLARRRRGSRAFANTKLSPGHHEFTNYTVNESAPARQGAELPHPLMRSHVRQRLAPVGADDGTRTVSINSQGRQERDLHVLRQPSCTGRLIVIKHVINDNGGTTTVAATSRWTLRQRTARSPFPGAESPGTDKHARRRVSYSVSESGGPSGYTAGYSGRLQRARWRTAAGPRPARSPTTTCGQADGDQARDQRQRRHPTPADFMLIRRTTTSSLTSPAPRARHRAGRSSRQLHRHRDRPAGYAASYSADCSGTLVNGESKTCTVTNNDEAAKLTVIKHVINDNGGDARRGRTSRRTRRHQRQPG